MPSKWKHQNREVSAGSTETIRWTLEEQWLLDGSLDVNLWVTIFGSTRQSACVWAGLTLSAEQVDDPVVAVTLSEVREAIEHSDYRKAADLLTLLTTM